MQKGFVGGGQNMEQGDGAWGQGEDEDEGWDIDTDSGFYESLESSEAASPLKRQMSMLGL